MAKSAPHFDSSVVARVNDSVEPGQQRCHVGWFLRVPHGIQSFDGAVYVTSHGSLRSIGPVHFYSLVCLTSATHPRRPLRRRFYPAAFGQPMVSRLLKTRGSTDCLVIAAVWLFAAVEHFRQR